MNEMVQGKYANVNNLNLYYEIHGGGKGSPLVLLHGGLGTISMFAQLLPKLAETRQVIAVELQGHGHTADIDRAFSFEAFADNVAALIAQLGFANADVMGYSLGGGVAIQTALRHPSAIRKLVALSAPCKSNGWYAEVLVGQRAVNGEIAKTWVGSPMQQAYASVAPQPENWTTLADKTGKLLSQDYDWSKDIAAMKTPTLIVAGDADAVRTAHAVEFFELLGGGKRDAGWDGSGMSNARLAILPGTTHYNITESPILGSVVTSFLDAEMTGKI